MLIRPLTFDFDPKKKFEALFNDEVARGVGILFNRGTSLFSRDGPTRSREYEGFSMFGTI